MSKKTFKRIITSASNQNKRRERRREGRELLRIWKKLWEGRSILGVLVYLIPFKRTEEGRRQEAEKEVKVSESVRRLNKNKNLTTGYE